MELIFASSNPGKIEEIKSVLPSGVKLISLLDLNFIEEIPETANTLKGNALLKAQFAYDTWNKPCFSDDSGLEINFLDGKPGVYSARYAGIHKDNNDNMDLVLSQMEHADDRAACFKTVITLITDGEVHHFEGRVDGIIRRNKKGLLGFGYDPIFEPEGQDKTFAEMTLNEKSKFSHRKRALDKMIAFVEQQFKSVQ
ncbi:MAG: RdgB/HAM1 family non-canonical purine NTP pyrophosphatase [Crocinitomicaceae bacterium]|nr:RdgB/HAM1 family non-canonical purine NTP pyrophosphatase [Crocinitomicaceae bacterium]